MQIPIHLDRASSQPLQDQLFEQMRQLIVSGKLKPNSRIIATRFMAEQVGVSRTTVLLVYERLISEGYLETRPTVGTFVSAALPDAPVQKQLRPAMPQESLSRQAASRPTIFNRFLPSPVEGAPSQFDFCRALPDSGLLPSKIWLRSTQRIVEQHGAGAADPLPPEGLLTLRQALADWLAARRGITITPEQVVIVSGFRQAYAILSHMFQKRGNRVVVESPGSEVLIHFLNSRGASLFPVPVDHQGLMTEHLPEDTPVSLACVTPARQNPIGGTLPLHRREKLIAWAQKTGAYIIENDSDSDLSYQGMTPSLAALDAYGLVFHVGSFAKTLGAGLCLGYIVAPVEFTETVIALKAMSDDGCSWIGQRVLADFIASGGYDQHLRRLRRTLIARRTCLIQALESHFGTLDLIGADAGTQVTWVLPTEFPSARTIRDLARAQSILVYALPEEDASLATPHPAYGDRVLVLSYAALAERQIEQGVARLARALKSAAPSAIS